MKIIHQTAVIGTNVTIEDDVYIGPLCVIGFPPEWKGREADGKGVVIRSGARLTGLVTVDSGADRVTEIGPDCYILKKAHIGHDAIIGEGTTLSCNSIIGGHTEIGKKCNIGLGAIIHQKLVIPDYVMIGMGGIVTKKSNIESWNIYAGNPVKLLSLNTHLIKECKEEYDRYLQNTIPK